MSGFVSLVGAGPGDPELLTLRALKRLEEAQVILYDALVSRDVLRLSPSARWFYVGKRAGRPAIKQDTIERLMIRLAKRGLRVVRLKCGDPFVFGRGGEEALALKKAGVPFEVVPGLSSAVAAPAMSGIPVTHRGLSTAFVTVSGHSKSAYGPLLQALPPQSATLVVLMGLKNRGAISSLLLERGWSFDTPAAVLLGATHPQAAVWRGALAELANAELDLSSGAPGILVVGQVVALAGELAPDEALPSSEEVSELISLA